MIKRTLRGDLCASWTSIRLLLSFVLLHHWASFQLDYVLAYPQAQLHENSQGMYHSRCLLSRQLRFEDQKEHLPQEGLWMSLVPTPQEATGEGWIHPIKDRPVYVLLSLGLARHCLFSFIIILGRTWTLLPPKQIYLLRLYDHVQSSEQYPGGIHCLDFCINWRQRQHQQKCSDEGALTHC